MRFKWWIRTNAALQKCIIQHDQGKLFLLFSRQVVSNSLQPHGPQHIRPPCPSPSPGVKENNIHGLICLGLPWWLSGKESPWEAGVLGSIPGSGRSPGEGNGNPLEYSWLENPMDRGAWRATLHGLQRIRHDWATKPPLPLIHMFKGK